MSLTSNAAASVLLLEGQKFYTETKYSLAVEAFSKALNVSKPGDGSDRIHLLDLRIAAYVKQKEFDLALKDAKEMVRQDRRDGRGYLRCGQILRLTEDFTTAMKWYEHGVKNIPRTDRLHSHTETQLFKTRNLAGNKMMSSKPTDPMTTLPLELVEFVISYFDYKQLVGILRVSKSWKRLLTRLSPLSDTIDFRNVNRKINYLMLNASIRRLSRYPKCLILSSLNDAAAKSMRERLDSWVNYRTLEHLEVHDSKFDINKLRVENFSLRVIVVGLHTSVEFLQTHLTLKKCPQLRIAKFCRVSSRKNGHQPNQFTWEQDSPHEFLEELEITCEDTGHLSFSCSSLSCFPNLTKLICRRAAFGNATEADAEELDLSNLDKLKELDLAHSLVHIGGLPDGLLTLRAAHVVPPPRFSWFRNLKVLDLYDCAHPPKLTVSTNDGEGRLEELTISFDKLPDEYPVLFFNTAIRQRFLSNLQYLRLAFHRLDDSFARHFIESMPKLERLVLENARISGVFLVDLLSAPSCKLQHIILRDCHRISPDAIEWIRSQGLMVDVKNASENRLGSRIIRS